MNKIFLVLALSIVMSGCGASEKQIQTAIALTEEAKPTASFTFIPSDTVTPSPSSTSTLTATPTHTPTFTITPSPTPDLRVIVIDPQEFLIKQEELPREGQYYLPDSTWMSLQTNEEIISVRGVEEGREYVINTGRVVGWFGYRARGTRTVRMPDEAGCGAYMFRTAEGAKLAVTDYNSVEKFPLVFSYVDVVMDDLGDVNVVYIRQKTAPGGEKNTSYYIQFSYRNYMADCHGYAYDEKDISHEFVENLARITLEKLEAAPLVSPEEAEKTFILYE